MSNKLERARTLICNMLQKGPVSAQEVLDTAKRSNISPRTLKTAKSELGIKSKKSSFDGSWLWSLPEKSNDSSAPIQEGKLVRNNSKALFVGFIFNEVGTPIAVRLWPGDTGLISFNKSIELAIIGGILKEVINEK